VRLGLVGALYVMEIGSREVTVLAERNYRALRARGITVRKTIDTLIATRCIVDGLPLLYSDRYFEGLVGLVEG